MKKIFLIVLLFFSSCGYNSIYVNKNLKNFESFFLVSDSDFNTNEIDANFIQQDSVVLQNGLKTYITRFKSVMSSNDGKI